MHKIVALALERFLASESTTRRQEERENERAFGR
jgi:hypothetical protein